uniref:SH2 domain-containing protein n=1 Tax=Anas platyrhynchos platyrhynchos TaxID=8840 RepID=A0A493TRS5_ANAPP
LDFPFFHGKITRKACEELLCKNGKNGSYLIRESESVEGAFYCLCLLTNFIFLSLQTSEGIPEKVFRTLKDLIYNYEKPNQGLVTNLRYPVKKTRPLQRKKGIREEPALKIKKKKKRQHDEVMSSIKKQK